MRGDTWTAILLKGVWLWIMLMALLFFAGNLATSKFIYVDF